MERSTQFSMDPAARAARAAQRAQARELAKKNYKPLRFTGEFDGIPMDAFGRPTTDRADLRTNVLHGLVKGDLKVYAPDFDGEEGYWGMNCAADGCRKSSTLLVGDDPEHDLTGTTLCEGHYRKTHGHRTPDYVVSDSDRGAGGFSELHPTFGEAGTILHIVNGVTPFGHPADMDRHPSDDGGSADIPVPSRVLHGSTQRMEVGDIISPHKDASVAWSTVNPAIAATFALNKSGNRRGDGGGAYVYEARPLSSTTIEDPRRGVGMGGFTHPDGLVVTKLLASSNGDEQQLREQMGRSDWLRHGIAEGRS